MSLLWTTRESWEGKKKKKKSTLRRMKEQPHRKKHTAWIEKDHRVLLKAGIFFFFFFPSSSISSSSAEGSLVLGSRSCIFHAGISRKSMGVPLIANALFCSVNTVLSSREAPQAVLLTILLCIWISYTARRKQRKDEDISSDSDAIGLNHVSGN